MKMLRFDMRPVHFIHFMFLLSKGFWALYTAALGAAVKCGFGEILPRTPLDPTSKHLQREIQQQSSLIMFELIAS